MPLFRVQLKQGKRTIVENVEAKSLDALLAFYQAITTMEVKEVLRVEYLNPSETVPIDDFNYQSLVKTIATDKETRRSRQFIFHNVKNSISEQELYSLMRTYLEVSGGSIDSITGTLFKAR